MMVLSLAVGFSACKSMSQNDSAAKDLNATGDAAQGLPQGCRPLSSLGWIRTFRQALDGGKLQLRVGIANAVGHPRGDILYLTGFADRLDNHQPLFNAWTQAGFRVISFDYPSHGETCGSNINLYKFGDLAKLAGYVESITREDATRSLILAGWSTGGLLAARILQGLPYSGRPIAGAILFSPGIDVYPLVGEHGTVTQATLTNNPHPPHLGTITPTSPLATPLFAADLLLNATLSRSETLSTNIPVLVFSGGDTEDVYVKSASIRSWVLEQRSGLTPYGISCKGARHELDNELPPVGATVRSAAADFAAFVVKGTGSFAPSQAGPCAAY